MSNIKTIKTNSLDGGEVYRLLSLVHAMAGSAANSDKKDWKLSRTNSDPMFGPILTVWTNGIVDVEARIFEDVWGGLTYQEYTLKAVEEVE